ncbi:VOC family protein [Maribellus sp. CM-23]|uniref:VOC family protein n=1 Tax=Maribellus sp. CM-23 TaxID=2781026 RepID=UPI001F3146D8|nr:VOC family protein [Maribellus sp. CM-23]MCE4565610.1 VOC family protein [Maribellus sp. CM-23]
MAKVNVYLLFNGDCEEAFNFYKKAFGGEFQMLSRFKDMPPTEGQLPESSELSDRILHVSLPISEETVLMGSDGGGDWAAQHRVGNNFSVSIRAESKKEADSLFNALSEGGMVTMPMQKTFWGEYFGMLVDKFEVGWMVGWRP